MLMMMGGCAGSASGGMKIVRVLLLLRNCRLEFKRIMHPNAVIPVHFNGKAVSERVVANVRAFVVLYMVIFMVGLLVFMALGIDFLEAAGTVISCLSNVGPALGDVANGVYAHFPIIAKWCMALLMLIGRLEIFTVLFVVMPSFWRN